MRENQDFFQSKQFINVAAITGLVVAVHTAINVFLIGGEDFVLMVNSYASFLFSSYAAILAIWTWNYTSVKDNSRRIWAGIALGLSSWAIADSISTFYPLLSGQDLSEISIADVFWLAAYIPLIIALVWRSRSFGIQPTGREANAAIALIIATVLISGYFVIWPAIQASNPNDLTASLINVLYPIGDAVIVIASLFILLTLGKGTFSSVWALIAIGLVLRAFGDLMYNYATGNNLYWPDDRLTLASILTDIPYSASYLAIALGIYAQRILSQQVGLKKLSSHVESGTLKQKFGYADILIFTDNQGKVAFLSNNFLKLVKAQNKARFAGSSLKSVLGLSAESQNTLMEDIRHLGYVKNQSFRVKTQNGEQIEVVLTAAASQSEGQFTGADIVLRAEIEDQIPDPETVAMAQQIYTRAGVRHTENLQIAKNYVQARILMLHALIRRMNGEHVASAMVNIFNQTAQEQNLHVRMDGETISFPENEPQKQLTSALPILTRTVTLYAENVAGYQAIEAEIKSLESKMDASALRTIDSFDVR